MTSSSNRGPRLAGQPSDSGYKRVDEVCGMLAEKGTELGGPWSDHLDGPAWELRIRLRDVAARRASPTHPTARLLAARSEIPEKIILDS
jgi:hypothetical protein